MLVLTSHGSGREINLVHIVENSKHEILASPHGIRITMMGIWVCVWINMGHLGLFFFLIYKYNDDAQLSCRSRTTIKMRNEFWLPFC